MLKTIRTEQIGKFTLRLLQSEDGYVGAVIGGSPLPHIHGDDPEQVWKKLRAEVGKASPSYFGFDGARARFLRLFPEGFAGAAFCTHERDYKVAASNYLKEALPLSAAIKASASDWEPIARAYSKTNMLSKFEHARTRDVLKSNDGAAFIQATAALASGDTAPALAEIGRIFKPHGPASWPAATYLPFLWRPEVHMFLKPQVTLDFAERTGHPFFHAYDPKLKASVYIELLQLAAEAASQLKELKPRDMLDVQSFIWIVGAYDGMTAVQPLHA